MTANPYRAYVEASNATRVRRVFFGLHEAHFADIRLPVVIIFARSIVQYPHRHRLDHMVKENASSKSKKPQLGYFLVERLNIAVIGGLPIGYSGIFSK